MLKCRFQFSKSGVEPANLCISNNVPGGINATGMGITPNRE